MPSNLLKVNKTQLKDITQNKPLISSCQASQAICINPEIVKFKGFEINKLNIFLLKVTNKADKPSRIYVLPT